MTQRTPGKIKMQSKYDVIIIGAGPAGLSAAIYVSRKKLKGLIISKDVGGQTLWSSDVENYLGFHMLTGPQLVEKFNEHLRDYDIQQQIGVEVKSVEGEAGNFVVKTNQGDFAGKTIIIASGKLPRHLNVPGEDKFLGRGLTYCANCDGPLFKNKEVAVIGGGNSALDAAILLDKIAAKVTIVNISPTFNTNADQVMQEKLAASSKVSIMHDTAVTEVIGDKFVEMIKVKNNKSGQEKMVACSGVFVEIGSLPSVDYLGGRVKMTPKNEIVIDEWNMTNVPGIFAAGDVTIVIDKQVVVAAGEGAKAALSVFTFLARMK